MSDISSIINLTVISFALACCFGTLTRMLNIPALVGYLLAGVAIALYSPGFEIDREIAYQLFDLGVIFMMFGIGIHFSLKELFAVKNIALPGAMIQIVLTTALGAWLGHFWGWDLWPCFILGLSISVASTVVITKIMEEYGITHTERGRIAIGWLIVEDLVMIFALILIPALVPLTHGESEFSLHKLGALIPQLIPIVGLIILKIGVFFCAMFWGGRKIIPFLLRKAAQTETRELFTIGVLSIALGVALGCAELFDVSYGLGAFFAGMILSETDLMYQATADSLPIQDAFTVLFFVTVGMMFDPSILWKHPLHVVELVAAIILGKSLIAMSIQVFYRIKLRNSITVATCLAQIGEFSFILSGIAYNLGIFPKEGMDLIVIGALSSIIINPFLFTLMVILTRLVGHYPKVFRFLDSKQHYTVHNPKVDEERYDNHVVVIGSEKIGTYVAKTLNKLNVKSVLLDPKHSAALRAKKQGLTAYFGSGTSKELLKQIGIRNARLVLITSLDKSYNQHVLSTIRKLNPNVEILLCFPTRTRLKKAWNLNKTRLFTPDHEVSISLLRTSARYLGINDEKVYDAMRTL